MLDSFRHPLSTFFLCHVGIDLTDCRSGTPKAQLPGWKCYKVDGNSLRGARGPGYRGLGLVSRDSKMRSRRLVGDGFRVKVRLTRLVS